MSKTYKFDSYKYVDAFQKEMTYFITVAETLNISKAAELLRIQQSGLSKAIQRLEEDLGQKLFQRKNMGLLLTPQGERFYLAVKDTKKHWEEKFNLLLNDTDQPMGMIRIGLHSSFGQLYLSQIILDLSQRFPQLELEIHDLPSFQTARKVLDNDIDFGIVVSDIKSPELIQKRIGSDYLATYQIHPDKLATHLFFNPDTQISNAHLKKFNKLKRIQIRGYELVAKAACESHHALAILPQSVARNYSNLKQTSGALVKAQISLICHKDKIKSQALRHIYEELLQSCRQNKLI